VTGTVAIIDSFVSLDRLCRADGSVRALIAGLLVAAMARVTRLGDRLVPWFVFT
jgi:hypothetical protein